MGSKIMYVDVETGGLNATINPIIQLAGIVEVNGAIKEKFNIKMMPEDMRFVEEDALKAIGLARDSIHPSNGYISQADGFKEFLKIIQRYTDVSVFVDKFYIAGYNIGSFDAQFLRKFFSDNDGNFGYHFWYPPIDILYLSGFACIGQREKLGNFKLMTVAKSLGIKVDIEQAHDALYDVEITKQMYDILREEYS